MLVPYFRSSSYTRWDFCPFCYWAEYVLGWQGPSNQAAEKGTIVHKVLELLAAMKKCDQDGVPYTDVAEEHPYVTLPSQGKPADIDMLTEQVYGYFSEHATHLKWRPADFRDCRNWTQMALDFNGGSFDPRQRDVVDAEPHFDFAIDDDWAKLPDGSQLRMKGTIDLVTRISPTMYEIIDWKSGSTRKNWATDKIKELPDFQVDPQVRIYHYAASELYPEMESMMVTVFFIRAGGPFTVCLTKDDIAETKRMLKRRFEIITDCSFPTQRKSWKCSRFCFLGKTTFEKTGIQALAMNGEPMTKCQQLHYCLSRRSFDSVVANMSRPGFDATVYVDPGQPKEQIK